MTAVSTGDWLPLTAAQRAVYLGHQVDPSTAAYNTAEYVALSGRIDPAIFRQALAMTLAETESLRLQFRRDGLAQRVAPVPAWELRLIDLRGNADPAGAARRWMTDAVGRRLKIEDGELFEQALLRLSDTETWWFQMAHHIALDGYGYLLLARRVAAVYSALVNGGHPEPHRFGALKSVIDEDLGYQGGPQRVLDREYFAGLVTGPPLDGPVGLGSAAGGSGAAPSRWVAEVPDTLATAVTSAAARLGSTRWTDVVIAATGAYLMRMTGSNRCRLALPLMNRTGGAVGSVVCTTMNLAPVELTLDPGIPPGGDETTVTVGDLVGQVTRQGAGLRRHGRYRAEDLARDAERGGAATLFGPQINLVPFELEMSFGPARGMVHNVSAGPVDDLTICLRGTPGRGRVRLELAGHSARYLAEDLALHGERLMAFVEAFAVADIDAGVGELALLTGREWDLVTTGFNASGHPVRARTLALAFAEQAARTPGAPAMIDETGTRSYALVNAGVDALAATLRAAGVDRGSVVGVALPRSASMVVAVHAVHRAGGAYLPLDPELPPARIGVMIQDAAPAVIITDAAGAAGMSAATRGSATGARVVVMDERLSSCGPAPVSGTGPVVTAAGPARLDDPAYLIFTSGSTGRPKAAVITHRAIDNRLAWMQHHFGLHAGERVLHKTPTGFDVSVWELFWPLQVGATLVVARPGGHRDPGYLSAVVAEHAVSTMHFVPSMLQAFLADRAAVDVVAGARCLRRVICSGEALPGDLARRAAQRWGAGVSNLYGPTEAAVDVTVHDVDPHGSGTTVPIGRPIWNTRCYVLDRHRRPVPIGAAGELYLGGVQLAQGYRGRPELTRERFVPDPQVPGETMYATGDVARWLPNGELDYLGRNDSQVKIRGQRAELGEIEAVLGTMPGVLAACVLIDPRMPDRLIGYLVPAPGTAGPDVAAVRRVAQAVLPNWMVPTDIVVIAALPLSPNGKLDRGNLPLPGPRVMTAGTAPSDPTTEQLCRVFAQVLAGERATAEGSPGGPGAAAPVGDRIAPVGPDDDFFAAGGNSLLALQLLTRIEEVFGVRPGIGTLFAHPTPAAVASELGHDAIDDLGTVLPLRTTGGQSPLFCIHPAGGLAWCYAGLLPHLPVDIPLYGLQAAGLKNGAGLPGDLGEMAASYVAHLRAVQPNGPYRLLGWSVGGLVAHEIACRLQQLGAEVELLVLMDAYPGSQWRHLPDPTPGEALRALLRIAGAEDLIAGSAEPTRRMVHTALTDTGSALATLPAPMIDAVIDIVRNNSRLVRRSEQRTFVGDILFIGAAATQEQAWLDRSGWRDHLTGSIVSHDLPVSHKDLVSAPALAMIGSLLTTRLSGAVAGHSGPRNRTTGSEPARGLIATAHR